MQCKHASTGQVMDVQIIDGTIIWNPPDETGGEITGYDVRCFAGGQRIHMQEGVTDTWHTPPESAQNARHCQVCCW